MNKELTSRSLRELLDAEALPAITEELEKVAAQFSVALTPALLALIDPKDAHDPIAAQFIPSAEELFVHPDELADPISDHAFTPLEGIVHRHEDRVLLKLLHACAAYCRFCFRREQISATQNNLSPEAVDKAISYIAQHKEIWEVILTGGDPFILSERRLKEIMERLNLIEHVKIIRFHTRVPVVDPERITKSLIETLKGRAAVYVLLHCNHARELTDAAKRACNLFIDAGIPMLSQSVLLRGVNDNAKDLGELMRAFVENRIKPHYLHHGDLVRGTSHFRIPLNEGQKLLKELRGLSGLCQPSYIIDIPGGHGKIPVNPPFAEQISSEKGSDAWSLEDHRGIKHIYRDSAPQLPDGSSEDISETPPPKGSKRA